MRKLSGYGPSIIVLLTAAVVLLLGPRIVQQLTYEHARTRIIQARHNLESPPLGGTGGLLEQLNQAYRDIATLVEPSVVHISAQYVDRDPSGSGREWRGLSTGSGWVFDDQGHVITNYHVVANAERIDVQLHTGRNREAKLIGADPTTDIAVIKIAPGLLHPAQLADVSAPVRQGDLVFAFGSPFDFRFSMSSGVVSGKDRSVGVLRDETGRRLGYENFIQVDAAINPGNSGGPLTDYRGRVIGMNTAIATGRRNSLEDGQFAGIGLAIPLDMIYPVVTQIIRNGYVEKGFLGVNIPSSTEENISLLARLGFNGQGVVVTDVQRGQAAASAGVLRNDIITHINGRPIASAPQLQSIISSMMPGDSANLTIWRLRRGRSQPHTSEWLQIPVPLSRLDMIRVTGRFDDTDPHDVLLALGLEKLETTTRELTDAYEVVYRPGVMMLEAAPDSRLAELLEPGTIIVAVNDFPVRTFDDFIAVLRSVNLSRPGVRIHAYEPSGRATVFRLHVD